MLPSKGPKSVSTFSQEGKLPKFPLPSLEDSLDKCKRFSSVFCQDSGDLLLLDEQIKDARNSLQAAQAVLEDRWQREENYVHLKVWEDNAYLKDRSPIVPIESTPLDLGIGLDDHRQMPRALKMAVFLQNLARIHHQLICETFPVRGYSESRPISMHQYRSVFETCRIPGMEIDTIERHFKTLSEASSQKAAYVIVCHATHLFQVNLYDSSLQLRDIVSLYSELKMIEDQQCSQRPARLEFGYLTGSKRPVWAEARKILLDDPENALILGTIEKSVAFLTMDDETDTSDVSDWLRETGISSKCGHSRFYDKSAQIIFFKDGRAGYSFEHSVMDAAAYFSTFEANDEMFSEYFRKKGGWRQELNRIEKILSPASLHELQFRRPSSDRFHDLLRSAKEDYLNRCKTCWSLKMTRSSKAGKINLRELGVSPDSFCQMLFQYTYYNLYGKIPSTYESVGVLSFRYGRTETGRSASVESSKFLKNAKDMSTKELGTDLRRVCISHTEYVKSVAKGEGFDRHLFALKQICDELSQPVPALLRDSVFLKASSWDLSTSNAFLGGNLHSKSGGTCFRPVGPHSIGIVYAIFNDCVDFTVLGSASPNSYHAAYFIAALEQNMDVFLEALHVSSQANSRL